MKKDLNVLYLVCYFFFRADRKSNIAILFAEAFSIFFFWNRLTEYNETGQEGIYQRRLPSLCFSSRSEINYGRPGLWLAETFSTSSQSLKPLNGIQTKLDRKRDLNVLYPVCVFRADPKSKIAALASNWLRYFLFLSLKSLNGIQQNMTETKTLMSSTKFVYFGPIRKPSWPPWPLIGWDTFDFLWNRWNLTGSMVSKSSTKIVFLGLIGKTKMTNVASNWLRQIRLQFFSETTEQNFRKLGRRRVLNIIIIISIPKRGIQVHDCGPQSLSFSVHNMMNLIFQYIIDVLSRNYLLHFRL